MVDFFKCPQDWLDFFYKDDVNPFVDEKNDYEPFYLIPYHKVNVVILVSDKTKKEYTYSKEYLSKSFQNIYKELENEGFHPVKDGNIKHWYKNGILFFDTESVNKELLNKIVCFLLEKKDIIWLILSDDKDDKKDIYNTIIEKSNTVFRKNPMDKSFYNSSIFKKINNILKTQKNDPIPW